jgi:putative transcriptional regulator
MTKLSPFAADLVQAMNEAIAYTAGEETGAITHTVEVSTIDTKAIRKHLGLTQEQMAAFLGTSVSGYRKWEQGQRQPNGAARTLLRVMEKEPEAVLRALRAA